MLNTSISFRPQRLSKLNKNYPLKTPIFNNFKTHKSFFVAPETGIYTVPTFANKRFYSDKKDDSKVNKYDEDEEDSRPATDEEIAETKEIMELFRQPKMKFHGDLNVPDYHYAFRDPDGKLRDAEGHEYGVTPSGEAEGVTDYTFEKYYKGLSITAKKHIAQFDKGAHEETIRFLKRAKILALRKIGVDEDLVITKDLPIEELKKVWDHVIRLSPEPMATTIMNFDAGTLEKRTIRFSDPFIHFITTRRYFLEHPNKTYLALSGLFMLGVIVALLIALYDNFLVEHEGSQQDRDKTYVRSRLLSSVAYTLAGIGAILLSAKLTTTHLLNRPPSASRTIAFGSFPLYLMFYFMGTYQNYPEKRPWGKLAIFGCLTAAAGASISAYTLRRGPGLVKLLVPVAAASLAGSASVAISPFDVNLEYGLPLAVLSATFAGLFGASAIFPAYRSYTRGSLATIFALSYAGLFLSYQQPLLNRIKFQEHYYGTEAFSNNSMLFLKSITFMPLKFYEYSSDALVTYYPKSILDLILPEPKDL